MNTRPLSLPPLPGDWPFLPRLLAPEAGLRRDAAIPGLGPDWFLQGVEKLHLDGEAEGLGGAFGRGGVFRVGSVVVRPYRRGGLVRHVIRRTYPGPGRFLREWEVHRALWAMGFPTVEPLGVAWRAHRLGVEGAFLTRLAQASPWPRSWTSGDAFLEALRTAFQALAAWGLWNPDLNATNVLVGSDGLPILLDWDRSSWNSSPGLLGRYRGRLAHSFRRLAAPPDLLSRLFPE